MFTSLTSAEVNLLLLAVFAGLSVAIKMALAWSATNITDPRLRSLAKTMLLAAYQTTDLGGASPQAWAVSQILHVLPRADSALVITLVSSLTHEVESEIAAHKASTAESAARIAAANVPPGLAKPALPAFLLKPKN